MARAAKNIDKQPAELRFLRTELATGLTLSRIAHHANHPDKADRNRANARKAYDAVLRFTPQVNLSQEETEEIKSKLAKLKAALQSLGESI